MSALTQENVVPAGDNQSIPESDNNSATSTNDYGENNVDWAIVCSATVEQLSDEQIKSFAEWYQTSMNNVSSQHHRDVFLAAAPSVIQRVTTGDKEAHCIAYGSLHTEHPHVAIVIHILPGHSSKDHIWMKQLSELYGIARQGMLYTNILTRFEEIEGGQASALNNMSSWLSHRMHTLAVGEKKEKGVHVRITVDNDYFVGANEEDKENGSFVALCLRLFSLAAGNVEQQRRTLVARRHTNKSELLTDAVAVLTEDDDKLNAPEIDYTFNVHAVTQAVWRSLHGFDSGHAPLFAPPSFSRYGKCRSDAWVEVVGFPVDASEWNVACQFAQYDVRSVYFVDRPNLSGKKVARVCLASRWEAVHCIEKGGWKYHDMHPLTVLSVHDRTADAADTAIAYDATSGYYKQYSSQKEFVADYKKTTDCELKQPQFCATNRQPLMAANV